MSLFSYHRLITSSEFVQCRRDVHELPFDDDKLIDKRQFAPMLENAFDYVLRQMVEQPITNLPQVISFTEPYTHDDIAAVFQSCLDHTPKFLTDHIKITWRPFGDGHMKLCAVRISEPPVYMDRTPEPAAPE
jgi:hypothetical protein